MALTLRLPDTDMTGAIADGRLGQDVAAAMMEMGIHATTVASFSVSFDSLRQSPSDAVRERTRLRRDYTQLFTHPTTPLMSIHETLFRDHEGVGSLFVSTEAMDAERCYRQAGVTASREHHEPADHMATEMEFMMFLRLQHGCALEQGDFDQVRFWESHLQEFKDLHLRKWAKEFFAALVERARTEEYKLFGRIGVVLMEWEFSLQQPSKQ